VCSKNADKAFDLLVGIGVVGGCCSFLLLFAFLLIVSLHARPWCFASGRYTTFLDRVVMRALATAAATGNRRANKNAIATRDWCVVSGVGHLAMTFTHILRRSLVLRKYH
jgi:hypothetical protein